MSRALVEAMHRLAAAPGGFHNPQGEQAARPEKLIRQRFAELKHGIGAPSTGAPAQPNHEKAQMRQEASAMDMTGKQYRDYIKKIRRGERAAT